VAAKRSRIAATKKAPKFESYLPAVAAASAWPENDEVRSNPSLAATARGAKRRRRAGTAVIPNALRPFGVGAGAQFGRLFAVSRVNALKLARQVVTNEAPPQERIGGTRDLVHWASATGNSEQRRTITQVFKEAKSQTLLVHHISELPMDQAESMMKDYFAGGGDAASVAEWLMLAGRGGSEPPPDAVVVRKSVTARRARTARGVRGFGDWFDNVVDWLGDKIGNIVNAIVKAGRSLASVIGEALSWTLDQLTDLAKALKRAGRAVAEVLSAAVTKGTAFMQKMIDAALRAGYALLDAVAWVAAQVVTIAKAAVQKLQLLGHSVLTLIRAVFNRGLALVRGLLQALMALGLGVLQILSAVAGQLLDVVQPVIAALRALSHTVRAILLEAVKLAGAAARLVIQALLALGTTLGALLAEVAGLVAATLRTVLSLLLQLGYGVLQLLAAVANAVDAVLRAVVSGLLELGQALAGLVLAAVQLGLQACHRVFAALLAIGRRATEILVALVGRTVSALRTGLEALLAMGIALAAIVADVLLNVAEGFRRGFFEGLIALGKAPVELLRAAALGGTALALLGCTVLLEIFGGHRGLTRVERAEAARIFGVAIDLDRVKIAVASLPADIINHLNDDRPFTSMYIINFGSGAQVDMGTLIHELTHVWQGVQEGPLYMTRALEAQLTAGVSALFHSGEYNDSAAYRVTDDMLISANGDFSRFNPEQQASIVEFYWQIKFNGAPSSGGPAIELLEPYALQVFMASRGMKSRKAAARSKHIGAKRAITSA
jgi:hypothetical protein